MEHDPTPKATRCERCGSDADLRLVVFRGRVRHSERTLCDDCAEDLFEMLLDTPLDAQADSERSRA